MAKKLDTESQKSHDYSPKNAIFRRKFATPFAEKSRGIIIK